MLSRTLFALLSAMLLVSAAFLFVPDARAQTEAASVNGKILTIDLGAKTLTVLKADNSTATLKFNKTTQIERNGKKTKIKALMLRDGIKAKFKANGAAIKFIATGPASKKVAGKLENALKGDGTVVISGKLVHTTAETRIVRNGLAVSLSRLTRQDKLVAHVKPGTTESSASEAFDLIADGPEDGELRGIISAISGNQVTVTPSNGTTDVTINVTDTTMIEVDGQHATLADLAVGMQVEASYDPTTFDAFSIETESDGQQDDAHISGTVSAVDVGAGTLTIAPTTGDPVTLTVDASTEIEVNGENGALADIQVGMPARAEYDSATLRAREVKAGDEFDDHGGGDDHDEEYIEGTIAAIDLDASKVTITPAQGGDNLVLNVTPESEIEVNDHDGSLADLQVGQAVRVKYDATTFDLFKLKVDGEDDDGDDDDGGNHDNAEVRGVIAAVDTTASTVTITPDGGGADLTLNVTDDTKIEINGEHGTIADLQVNDAVRAEYEQTSLNATEIKVGEHGGGDHKTP